MFNSNSKGGGVSESFETVAGNHQGYPSTITYNASGVVTGKAFDTGSGTIDIVYAYDSGGALTSKTLSGAIPSGIATVKTFAYDSSGNLTGTDYS